MAARPDNRQQSVTRRAPAKPGRPGEPFPVQDVSTSLIGDLWRGDIPLVKTYWLFGVLIGICFAMVFFFIEYLTTGLSEGFGPVFILGMMLLYFIYTGFINIAIWRSASKYRGPRRWSILAKIMVLVSWAALIHEAWQIYTIAPV